VPHAARFQLAVLLALAVCGPAAAQRFDTLADPGATPSGGPVQAFGPPLLAGYEDHTAAAALWQEGVEPPLAISLDPATGGGPEVIPPGHLLPVPDPGFFGPLDGDVPPAPTASSGRWLRPGCWYVNADSTLMWHSRPKLVSLAITNQFPTLNVIRSDTISTNNINFPWEAGMKLTFGKNIGRDAENRDHAIELTVSGLNHWSAGFGFATTGDDTFLFSVLDPGVVRNANVGPQVGDATVPGFVGTQQVINYTSDYYSYEFNWRMHPNLGYDRLVYTPDGRWSRHATSQRYVSYMAGLRLISYEEKFGYTSFNATNGDNGSLQIRAENNMFGIQGGADWIDEHELWDWGLKLKLGLFGNAARQRSQLVTTPDNAVERDRSAHSGQLAVVGETGLNGTYRIRPNMYLKAGYDVIWIQGIALAPTQATFDPAGPESIDAHDFTVMMGATFGFEMYW